MIPGDELRVGLGQIERQAVGLGEGGDEEDQEARQLPQDVPAVGLLVGHDVAEPERPGRHQDADDGHAHRQLVRDELRRRAKPAHEGIFVVRRPAGESHPVDAHRGEGQHDQNTVVDVGDLQADVAAEGVQRRTEGHDREGDERGDEDQRRSQDVDRLVDEGRDDGLLEEKLDPVGQRLQEAERPDPIGAPPILDPGRDAPFNPGHVGDGRQHHEEEEGDLDRRLQAHLKHLALHVRLPEA